MRILNFAKGAFTFLFTVVLVSQLLAQVPLDSDNDGISDDFECGCPAGALVNGSFETPVFRDFAYEIYTEDKVLGWETTATDDNIELWSNSFFGVSAAEGRQFAELNAFQNAALYQKLCLQPGMVVQWAVKHRGRSGTDVAVVKIGGTLATASIVYTMTDGNTAWGQHTGTYTVPDGQLETFFVFEAVSSVGGTTIGNFIDDVVITVLSRLPCTLDTDGDGITDNLDLDSDNDGVSDSDECGVRACVSPVENRGFEIPAMAGTTSNMFGEDGVPGWETTSGDNLIELWTTGFSGVPSAEARQFAELNANQAGALYQELCLNPGTKVEWKVKHRGRLGTDVAVVKIGASLQAATTQTTMTDGNSSWGQYSGEYTVPVGQNKTFFMFEAVSSTGNTTLGNFIDDVEINIISATALTCLDSDADGIPNAQELDSDNDGCVDAAEAYNDFSVIGDDNNSYYGEGSPPQVDEDGKVVGASYNVSITSLKTPSTATTITSQPVDASMFTSTPVTFSVNTSTATDTIKYQWQVSTDEGETWGNVSDTSFYGGFKTKTLTVKKTKASMDENDFRCKITQTSRACTILYSDTVNLNTCSLAATAKKISDQTCVPLSGNPSDGKLYVEILSGATPIAIKWSTSPQRTTDTIDQLSPGSYMVTLTDADGCKWSPADSLKVLPATISCCKNPTSGGVISSDQFLCINMKPIGMVSESGATGEVGILQYKWQASYKADHTDWTDIAGATGLTYQPGLTEKTVWLRRLAKVDCFASWSDAASSNIVKLTVVPNTDRYLTIESLRQPTCNPPQGCKITVRGLPMATWTMEQTGPVSATLTGNDNPLLLENLPDGVYKLRVADQNGCIESPPFGVIVVTY